MTLIESHNLQPGSWNLATPQAFYTSPPITSESTSSRMPTISIAANTAPSSRIPLFGFELDALSMSQTVERVFGWVARGERTNRFVVTPNVDHAVLYQHNAELRAAYDNAALILADGMPVLLAAKLLGRHLPGRVPGSDLAPALFNAAAAHGMLKVYLLGAGPGVAERAAERIHRCWPNVRVVGTYSPPLGFERDEQENEKILAQISETKPDLLIVGLGAPKQELWVNAHRHQIDSVVTLCIGATIDFLAGEKKRAPVWMRRCGLEWLHRVATEPRRLFKRYARDAWVFPRLVAKEWAATWRRPKAAMTITSPGTPASTG